MRVDVGRASKAQTVGPAEKEGTWRTIRHQEDVVLRGVVLTIHLVPCHAVLCCVQEREAAQRAAELASRALAAEKRLVEAMKDEAAASAELLEAERAAKFAAQVCARAEGGAPLWQQQRQQQPGWLRTAVGSSCCGGHAGGSGWRPCSLPWLFGGLLC